jgi:protein-disulfide isomerase
MSKAIAVGVVGLGISAAMLGLGFMAGKGGTAPADAAPMSMESTVQGMDRASIEALIYDYLVSNPEVMLDVQAALETRERETRTAAARNVIAQQANELFNATHDGIVGNPEGDVTIVEFFDYNCGFCKRAMDDMDAVIAADPNVRFVLKEFPILGPDSQAAHVVSKAFNLISPENYGDFHRALMNVDGRANEASAIRIALEHGVEEADLRSAMQDPAVMEAFERNYALANRLSVTGTPSYVIGEQVVFGAQGASVLFDHVETVRADAN